MATPQVEASAPRRGDATDAGRDEDGVTMATIFNALWRRWTVLFATFFSVVVLGFVIVELLTPTYTSVVVLILSERQDSVVDMQQSFMNMPPADPVVRSEADALQSRTLVDRVVDREHLMQDPEFNLYIRPFHPNPFICIPASILPGFIRVDLGCKKRDPGQLTPAQIKYNVATQVLRAYDVEPDPKTYTVKLEFTSVDAIKAARIANAFVDEYMRFQIDEHIAEARRATALMNPQLAQLSHEVALADHAVEDFKAAHHIIDLPNSQGENNTLALQEVQNLAQELAAARATRAQLEAAQQEVQALIADTSQTLSAPAVAAAPLVENVREQEIAASAQLASLEGTYGDHHPLVVSAKNEVERLHERVGEEARRAVAQLDVQKRQAEVSEQELQARMNQLTSARTAESNVLPQLRQLESTQAAAKTVYDVFVQGLFRAASENGVPTAKGHIVQHADIVDWPTFPNMLISAALIFVIAAIMSFGGVYVVEAADSSFHTPDQIERVVGLPVLGITFLARRPIFARRRSRLAGARTESSISRKVVSEPASAMSEALRLTRTAISFSRADRRPKVIMITSAVPAEGKTTFTLMLARQSAASGYRTIAIEAELRRPTFKRELSSPPLMGLADHLEGRAALADIIGIDPHSGAHYVSAGACTSSASELLGSAQMATLLRELGSRYDLVVIDTPPPTIVADALQLGSMIDAAILVIQWASTPRHLVLDAVKKLYSARIPLVGAVMTQVDSRRYKYYGGGALAEAYAKPYYA